mmetsp:Transcript_46590/g.110787  ORF Transcript_46590/g.110787 Transcript_46590/m.110787 type:complete len:121 (-) Transcript_46590:36-398(-)
MALRNTAMNPAKQRPKWKFQLLLLKSTGRQYRSPPVPQTLVILQQPCRRSFPPGSSRLSQAWSGGSRWKRLNPSHGSSQPHMKWLRGEGKVSTTASSIAWAMMSGRIAAAWPLALCHTAM